MFIHIPVYREEKDRLSWDNPDPFIIHMQTVTSIPFTSHPANL